MIVEEKPDFYKIAWEEIENGNYDKSCLARAFVKSNGDENRTKVIYIKFRVKALEELFDKTVIETIAYQKWIEEEQIRNSNAEIKAEADARENERHRILLERKSAERDVKKKERGGLLVCSIGDVVTELKSGDVILYISSSDIRNNESKFYQELEEADVNEKISFRVIRDIEFITVFSYSVDVKKISLSKIN